MKKSDIYGISIKILGLYLLATTVIESLQTILSTYLMFSAYSQVGANTGMEQLNVTPYLIIGIINFLILASLALFLVFRTETIVKKICSPGDYEDNVKLFAEPKVIYEVALVTTGLIIILWTLPQFALKLVNYIREEQISGSHKTFDGHLLITSAIKIVASIFAIFSAKSIANYLGRRKEIDVERNSKNTDS